MVNVECERMLVAFGGVAGGVFRCQRVNQELIVRHRVTAPPVQFGPQARHLSLVNHHSPAGERPQVHIELQLLEPEQRALLLVVDTHAVQPDVLCEQVHAGMVYAHPGFQLVGERQCGVFQNFLLHGIGVEQQHGCHKQNRHGGDDDAGCFQNSGRFFCHGKII